MRRFALVFLVGWLTGCGQFPAVDGEKSQGQDQISTATIAADPKKLSAEELLNQLANAGMDKEAIIAELQQRLKDDPEFQAEIIGPAGKKGDMADPLPPS